MLPRHSSLNTIWSTEGRLTRRYHREDCADDARMPAAARRTQRDQPSKLRPEPPNYKRLGWQSSFAAGSAASKRVGTRLLRMLNRHPTWWIRGRRNSRTAGHRPESGVEIIPTFTDLFRRGNQTCKGRRPGHSPTNAAIYAWAIGSMDAMKSAILIFVCIPHWRSSVLWRSH